MPPDVLIPVLSLVRYFRFGKVALLAVNLDEFIRMKKEYLPTQAPIYDLRL